MKKETAWTIIMCIITLMSVVSALLLILYA